MINLSEALIEALQGSKWKPPSKPHHCVGSVKQLHTSQLCVAMVALGTHTAHLMCENINEFTNKLITLWLHAREAR